MKKRFLPTLAVLCITAALIPGTVLASSRSSSSTQVEKRSEEEIQKYFRSHSFDRKKKDTWTTETDMSKEEAGKLSETTVNEALNALNFIRYIAGIPEVTNNSQYEEYAQAGAALMQHMGKMTHTPKKPDDVSQEFFDKAYKGTSSSNIAYSMSSSGGPSLNLASTVIESWMSDEDESNIDRVGHRRWCINPRMKQTGFGASGYYAAIYAFDTAASSNYEYVPWPAQVMPVEYFYGPWSVSLNSNVYQTTDNIEVTLSSKTTGEEYVFDSSCTDKGGKYFNVDTANYGMGPAIIFEPVGPSGYGEYNSTFSAGDEVSVTITGLKDKDNQDTSINYTVNFFSMEDDSDITNITLNENSLSMKEGESFQLNVRGGSKAAWSSSDKTVAAVDDNGKVTAVKEGKATITATVNGATATCEITVVKKQKTITLDKTTYEMKVNDTFTLTVSDGSDTAPKADWTSSDKTVAVVDSNGKVTAVKKGTAKITAKVKDAEASCVITVTENPKNITLNKTSHEMKTGETFTLTVSDGSDTVPKADWTSSDKTIATVDSSGKVTAVKEGKVTITAKVDNAEAVCTITITKEQKKITLNETAQEIEVGKTFQLSVSDGSGTAPKAVWTSSDSTVASVNDNGLVKAVKAGKAVITAKVEDAEATCTITVKEPEKPKEISLNYTSYNMVTTETLELKAATVGFDAAPEITWTSSDSKIAVVDKNGKVKPVKEGKVTITAKAGEAKADCVIEIVEPDENPDEIKLNYSSYELEIGKTIQLKVIPEASSSNANRKTEWTSSDSSIAEVDDEGIVTAVKEGAVRIKAVVGNSTVSCRIIVKAKSADTPDSISLNYSSRELRVGNTVQLRVKAKIGDSSVDIKADEVKWSSSDSSIAEVDKNGLVKAVKTGTATITAEADGLTADCDIMVTSGSGSSGSSGSGSKRRKTDNTQNNTAVNQGSSSRPSYVVQGAWNQNADGSWNFTDSSGKAYKNSWGAVVNPYASTASGQQEFDWFFFDENGRMRTGWFVDADGNTYYLNENSDGTRGRMMTGWCWVVDAMGVQRCYYLNPISDGTKGKLLVNTVIDGYTINEKGEWTIDGIVQTR